MVFIGSNVQSFKYAIILVILFLSPLLKGDEIVLTDDFSQPGANPWQALEGMYNTGQGTMVVADGVASSDEDIAFLDDFNGLMKVLIVLQSEQ